MSVMLSTFLWYCVRPGSPVVLLVSYHGTQAMVFKPWYSNHGTQTMVFKPWYSNHGTQTMVFKPWYSNHDTQTMVFKPWYSNHGIQTMVLKPWYLNHGTQAMVFKLWCSTVSRDYFSQFAIIHWGFANFVSRQTKGSLTWEVTWPFVRRKAGLERSKDAAYFLMQ